MPRVTVKGREGRQIEAARNRTRRAWLRFRVAELAWRESCYAYQKHQAKMHGVPPELWTEKYERLCDCYEIVVQELCGKALEARDEVIAAIKQQRVAQIREEVRLQLARGNGSGVPKRKTQVGTRRRTGR